ncbi:MAG: type VI secretion system baseplate subunit TssF [Calditrichaeota bacterium]|nr:MAG: type VI secretion system baseplate subunit TssF [Calditrichota bacterium]
MDKGLFREGSEVSIEKYFEREYNFLQIAGEEFAEKHQSIAGRLRLSERQRKDPFVERLMEAFAFLAGRIHERLDDEIPEFTGGLLEQLFPHFLRPFPSCALLEAECLSGSTTKPVKIERGSEVQTPTGKYKVKYKVAPGPEEKARVIEKIEAAEFIFRTTQDLVVRPMRLKDVRLETVSNKNSMLVLQIHPERNVDFESLELNTLRLYLAGAESVKYALLLYLLRDVKSIKMRELERKDTPFRPLETYSIDVPGLTDYQESPDDYQELLPYARQSFKGFRLLQEYFSYPERFFFLDVKGLDAFEASSDGHPFEIAFEFERKLSTDIHPTTQNILLHCTPIINLFDRPTEEVPVTQRLPEYHIIPDIDRRKSREIYSVKKVIGIGENHQEQYQYVPIASYDILDTHDPEYEYKRFYTTVRRPVLSDMAETAIRLFGSSMEADILPRETLSVEAILSNGFLPAKYLEVGSITEPIDFPAGLKVKNLTVPSEVLPHPERRNFLWALISHLSVSYQSLAQTENLKTILSLYNWATSVNNPNKKRIESIIRVRPPRIKNVFKNRALVKVMEFVIEIEGKQFEHGEGDIYLFGWVLNRFLSEYITINSFLSLTLIDIESKKEYHWEPNLGKILPV